jgi:hypothetical protein
MYFVSIGLPKRLRSKRLPNMGSAVEPGGLAGDLLFSNLLPVTIGNIIGSLVLVAAVIGLFFSRKTSVVSPAGDADRMKKQNSCPSNQL